MKTDERAFDQEDFACKMRDSFDRKESTVKNKKQYVAPVMIEYGTISERTLYYAGGCSPLDPSGGCPPKSKTACSHLDFAGEWSCSS
jgi:hypothetical protein